MSANKLFGCELGEEVAARNTMSRGLASLAAQTSELSTPNDSLTFAVASRSEDKVDSDESRASIPKRGKRVFFAARKTPSCATIEQQGDPFTRPSSSVGTKSTKKDQDALSTHETTRTDVNNPRSNSVSSDPSGIPGARKFLKHNRDSASHPKNVNFLKESSTDSLTSGNINKDPTENPFLPNFTAERRFGGKRRMDTRLGYDDTEHIQEGSSDATSQYLLYNRDPNANQLSSCSTDTDNQHIKTRRINSCENDPRGMKRPNQAREYDECYKLPSPLTVSTIRPQRLGCSRPNSDPFSYQSGEEEESWKSAKSANVSQSGRSPFSPPATAAESGKQKKRLKKLAKMPLEKALHVASFKPFGVPPLPCPPIGEREEARFLCSAQLIKLGTGLHEPYPLQVNPSWPFDKILRLSEIFPEHQSSRTRLDIPLSSISRESLYRINRQISGSSTSLRSNDTLRILPTPEQDMERVFTHTGAFDSPLRINPELHEIIPDIDKDRMRHIPVTFSGSEIQDMERMAMNAMQTCSWLNSWAETLLDAGTSSDPSRPCSDLLATGMDAFRFLSLQSSTIWANCILKRRKAMIEKFNRNVPPELALQLRNSDLFNQSLLFPPDKIEEIIEILENTHLDQDAESIETPDKK